MKDIITVYFNGSGVLVSTHVAQKLGLVNGQILASEAMFWQVIGENATYGLMCIELEQRSN